MGRKSREKRERRENGSGPIALAAKGTNLLDLVALLEAASVSPTASHKIPSLALVFESAIRKTRTGTHPATPELLPKLISAAQKEDPHLCIQEDWIPYDVRAKVVVRWCGGLYRLVPGCLERPVATVDFLDLLCSVIDPVLIEHNGYGLRDVVELVLRRIDHVATTLAPTWSHEALEDSEEPASICMEELAAARTLRPISEITDSCTSPERARTALKRHSAPAKRLVHQGENPTTTLGATIGVLTRGREPIALPAGLLISELHTFGAELAVQAFELDPKVEDRWAGAVGTRIGHALAGSGHGIVGPIRTPQGGVLHSVTSYSRQQILVIDTISSLQQIPLQDRFNSSSDLLDSIEPGTELDCLQSSVRIAPDAEVTKLVVLAAPPAGKPLMSRKYPVATLEDLLWISRTCPEEPVDLWHFVHELTEPRGVGGAFYWDLIDAWEVWRGNGKTFYRGGSPLGMLMFAPHAAEAEWQAAADASPYEAALLALRLPALPEWPLVDDLAEISYIGDKTIGSVFRIFPWDIPVAVATTDPSTPRDPQTVWSLADGIAWKLKHMEEEFHEAANASGVAALRIHLRLGFAQDNDGSPLWLEEQSERTVTLGMDPHLIDSLIDDSHAIEALAGRLIAKRFRVGQCQDDFVAAWDAAPPCIRADGESTLQRTHDLPEPIEPHDSHRSAAQQRLSEHLLSSGAQPGTYEGREATRLESNHVYPWLIAELHRVLRAYSQRALLEMGFAELERANFKRWFHYQQVAHQRGFPVYEDTEGDAWEMRRTAVITRARSISLILEEILAQSTGGELLPDRAIWQEALSISDLCLESGVRSETIHLNLSQTTVHISENFVIDVHWSDEPTDFDSRAYSKRRSQAELPEANPIGRALQEDSEHTLANPKPFSEWKPELEPIDAALKHTLGFGLDALADTLCVACQWHVSKNVPVASTTISEFLSEAVRLGTGGTREEYQSAIEWLSLRDIDLSDDSREHWETEKRAVRLATRPLVNLGTYTPN